MPAHGSYQWRERVTGHVVDLVIGAPSETISGMGRLARGRQIRDCARQHEASHCLIQADVSYFADSGGLCLAAQIERPGSPFYGFGPRYLLCVPFDQMVYLCNWEEGLARDERAVTLERAREELSASAAEELAIVMVPVGQLAAQLGDSATEKLPPSALSLRGRSARNYRYRPVLGCLLAHGLPVPAHALPAAIATAALLTASWYAESWTPNRASTAQALAKAALTLPISLPAAAARGIRDINQLGSQIAPWAPALGVHQLRIKGTETLISGSSARRDYRRSHATALGFKEASHEGETFRWRRQQPAASHVRRQPIAATELATLMESLAQFANLQLTEQRRRSTDYGLISHIRLRADRAIHYLLAELAMRLEGVPAHLVNAEMQFDRRGRTTHVDLLLAIPARGSLP